MCSQPAWQYGLRTNPFANSARSDLKTWICQINRSGEAAFFLHERVNQTLSTLVHQPAFAYTLLKNVFRDFCRCAILIYILLTYLLTTLQHTLYLSFVRHGDLDFQVQPLNFDMTFQLSVLLKIYTPATVSRS